MSGRGKGGKGLGKGGAKRHRKILRDNIRILLIWCKLTGRGNHKARYPPSCASWWCQAYLWPHLRRDPRRPQSLPRRSHPRCSHLHRARQAKDRHVSRCRLCSQASRTHNLRFRWLDSVTLLWVEALLGSAWLFRRIPLVDIVWRV